MLAIREARVRRIRPYGICMPLKVPSIYCTPVILINNVARLMRNCEFLFLFTTVANSKGSTDRLLPWFSATTIAWYHLSLQSFSLIEEVLERVIIIIYSVDNYDKVSEICTLEIFMYSSRGLLKIVWLKMLFPENYISQELFVFIKMKKHDKMRMRDRLRWTCTVRTDATFLQNSKHTY